MTYTREYAKLFPMNSLKT